MLVILVIIGLSAAVIGARLFSRLTARRIGGEVQSPFSNGTIGWRQIVDASRRLTALAQLNGTRRSLLTATRELSFVIVSTL